MDLEGKYFVNAFEMVVQKLRDEEYFEEKSAVFMSAALNVENSITNEKMLVQQLMSAKYVLNKSGEKVSAKGIIVDKSVREKASELNVSMGRYVTYLAANKQSDMSLDLISEKSVQELFEIIDDNEIELDAKIIIDTDIISQTPVPVEITQQPVKTMEPVLSPTPPLVEVMTPEPISTSTPEPTPTLESTSTPVSTSTPEPTPTLEPTSTPVSTSTPEPTPTSEPTSTPVSTSTPEPTPTSEPTPTTTPSTIEVKTGTVEGEIKEGVEVPVYFEGASENGVSSCEFTLTYDREDIEVQEITTGAIVVNPGGFSTTIDSDNGTIKFTYAGETINVDGEFARIRVRIKEGAEIGFSQVKLTEESFIGGNLIGMIVTSNEDGGVEVKSTPTPEPTPEPTPPSGLYVLEDWEEYGEWTGGSWVTGDRIWSITQPINPTDEWYSHGSKSMKLPSVNTFLNMVFTDKKTLEINAKAKLRLDVYISESERFSGAEVQLKIQFGEGTQLYYSDKVTVPEGGTVTVTFDLENVQAPGDIKIPPEVTILNVNWLEFTFNGLVNNSDSTDFADIYVDYIRFEN